MLYTGEDEVDLMPEGRVSPCSLLAGESSLGGEQQGRSTQTQRKQEDLQPEAQFNTGEVLLRK